MNKVKYLSLFSCLFLVSCNSNVGQFISAYQQTEQFKRKADNKENESALNHAASAQEALNGYFVTDSNLGIAFYLNQKFDQTEKSLLVALAELDQNIPDKDSAKRKEAEFILNYNLGVFYGSQMKVDEALKYYQRALDIKPDSKETKENIELLIQKQQQEQKQQQQQQSGEGQKDPKDGQGQSKEQNPDQKDQQGEGKKKDQEGDDPKDNKNKETGKSPKYKPRPFKGDQLSEGDVKKILGELSSQDKKIRSQYEQKNRKEGRNEKDW